MLVNKRFPTFYLIPSIGIIIFVFLIPMLWALNLGFTNYNLERIEWNFVYLKNYFSLTADSDFLNSIKITFIFMVFAVGGHLILGLIFANFYIIKDLKFKKTFSVLILIPWLTPGLVEAFMWRSVLNYEYGWLNNVFNFFGLEGVDWLFDYPMLSILLANWPRGMAISFLLLVAALQSIPDEIYDSTKIDGCNSFQTLLYVKIPMIRYSILVSLLISTFGTLFAFDMIYGLTGGGPLGQTEVISIFIYNNAFEDYSLGYASAISTIVLILALILGLLYIKSLKIEF